MIEQLSAWLSANRVRLEALGLRSSMNLGEGHTYSSVGWLPGVALVNR